MPDVALRGVRLAALTALALLAFAANSLLCRLALQDGGTDPASFTLLRLAAGAAVLALLVAMRGHRPWRSGRWHGAVALFVYAAGFSFAYVELDAGTGALLLFGAVQLTMLGTGLWQGERLRAAQWLGIAMAVGGVVGLLLPGAGAPSLVGAMLMIGAGVAWGAYSLWGRSAGEPVAATTGHFLRALPFALALWGLVAAMSPAAVCMDGIGLASALASGAITSGLGYVLWYAVLPALGASKAAALQLSVPALAAIGGVLVLGEPMHGRLVAGGAAILVGIALVLRR